MRLRKTLGIIVFAAVSLVDEQRIARYHRN
jgi:hypothetical protein